MFGIDSQTFEYGERSETGTKHNRRLYNAIGTQPLDTYRIRKRNRNTAEGYAFRTESEHNRRTSIIYIYIGNGIGNTIAASIFGGGGDEAQPPELYFGNGIGIQLLDDVSYVVRNGIEPQSREIYSETESVYDSPRMYSETESKQRPKSALAALNTKTGKGKTRQKTSTHNPSPKKNTRIYQTR